MLNWLLGNGKKEQTTVGTTACVIRETGTGTFRASFRAAVLPWEVVRDAASSLETKARQCGAASIRVVFDFSDVTALEGPWGVHFALLKQFRQATGFDICMAGLARGVAGQAALFRRDTEIREMILAGASEPNAVRGAA